MKISAHNQLAGTIIDATPGAFTAHVALVVTPQD
jgi:molybdopterin-binding protein